MNWTPLNVSVCVSQANMTKSYDSIQAADREGWENSSLFSDGKPSTPSTLHTEIIALENLSNGL